MGTMRNCCTVIIVSLLIGMVATVLSLFQLLIFTPVILLALAAIGLVLLGIIAVPLISAGRCNVTSQVYCCCGNMAIIGAIGTILTGLLAALFALPILVNIFIGIAFFFLGLALGGIWCFLRAYYACGCDCDNDCC